MMHYRLLLLLLMLALAGCQGKKLGTAKGIVTYKGQPITDGEVNFHSREKGIGTITKIDSSGQYALPDPIEIGDYVIWVTPQTGPPPDPSKPPPKKSSSNIPMKARDMNTSTLKATIKEGPNDIDISLD